jgi:hypothetical protein
VGERRTPYSVLVRKPEEKTSLRRPWRRLEDYIKMDHKKIRWEVMN